MAATRVLEETIEVADPSGATGNRGELATAPLADPSSNLRFVARQPILDLHGRVHGYELLSRSGPEAFFHGDGDVATRTMFDNAVIFGLDRLTGSLPAFVNCTQEALTGDLIHMLPPSMTVLEILENVRPTPAVIEACRRLKSAGFRLALDDFAWSRGVEKFVELADFIKVDFVLSSSAERESLLRRLRPYSIGLVAEKIENQEEYALAREEGFTLFQGYFFCRPILMKNRKVPANKFSHLEILRVLKDDPVNLRKLSALVKKDASLTYRLLRLINSPFCAVRQEVSSVQGAIIAIGEDTFRRMATLAIASELNAGQPSELLRMAFVRARFCELTAPACGLDGTEQYLLGLLSLLSAMLRVPVEELTPNLPVRRQIQLALQGAQVPERILLNWIMSHERGDWAGCDTVADNSRLNRDQLARNYAEAVVWAEEALHAY